MQCTPSRQCEKCACQLIRVCMTGFKLNRPSGSTVPVTGQLHIRFLVHTGAQSIPATSGGHLPHVFAQFSAQLVSADMILAKVVLRFLEKADLLNTPIGEKALAALLTVHQNNTFLSTVRLLTYCVEQEAK